MRSDPGWLRTFVRDGYETDFRGDGAALPRDEAEAIVEIARIAVASDGHEDPEELATFEQLAASVFDLANIPESDRPSYQAGGPADRRRMHALAAQLQRRASRELAYAIAYLVTVADLDEDRREEAFLQSLRGALEIDTQRASELGRAAALAVTPRPLPGER